MNSIVVILIIIAYLAVLFSIAFYTEKKSKAKLVNSPYVYVLSLAVYCSAWTYYGSVGVAANSGVNFIAIYLGPIIAAPIWIIVLRKVIRIAKQHKISSLADFISLRYGKNRFLGALVTLVCLAAILPYISLQLKAVSETFEIMTFKEDSAKSIFQDTTFYISLLLAIFAAFFGTQTTDASKKHRGIVVTVAFESLLKLVFFLIVGVYITYFLFDGMQDIVHQASALPNFSSLIRLNGLEEGFNWFFTIMLSFVAIFLLPRQFQMGVLESNRLKDIKTAVWLFPLYLLLFNIFVIFIAWAGKLQFGNEVNSEYYTLFLPLKNGNSFLALLVFLGGLSAVISMVVVSTFALSIMLSNNLIIPYGFLKNFKRNESLANERKIKNIRRVSIFSVIVIAYLFYYGFSVELSLYAIGLISFVIVAQLAPSFFIGLFWNRGSSKGAIIGLLAGLAITFYTLILPFTIEALTGDATFTQNGLFHIPLLNPHSLFGIDFLSPAEHAFFWSITINTVCYIYFSLNTKGNYRERNYAEMFVESRNYTSLQEEAYVWRGEAYVEDIKDILVRFLGRDRTKKALASFYTKYNIDNEPKFADAKLIHFSEQVLTGSIGSSSARILIQNVVKEEEITLVEVLKILEESKDAIAESKALKSKSKELKKLAKQLQVLNEELLEKDRQKDEFLDTVAHELKTPLTGMRAATEILLDNPEIEEKDKNRFLSSMLHDAERLSRLIHNILDFEKLSKGKAKLDLKHHLINKTIAKVIDSFTTTATKKNIAVVSKNTHPIKFLYDEDRMIQVLTNLISNSLKFCEPETGVVSIDYKLGNQAVEISVKDNGKGFDPSDMEFVFDKFYQSKNQNVIKPKGSGLGLAITKQIVVSHGGEIFINKKYKDGAEVIIKIPINE